MKFIEKSKNLLNKISENKYYKMIILIPWVVFCAVMAYDIIKNGKYRYETNDDMLLEFISGGAYGKYYVHNIYNNVVLGYVFSFLYQTFPKGNWNNILYLGMIFISFLVVGICNVVRNKPIKGYLLSLIFVFATSHSLIIRMNYSKTGILTLAVGLFLLATTLDSKEWISRRNRIFRIIAYILMSMGAMVRKDSVIACVPFFVVIAIYIFTKYRNEKCYRCIPILGIGAVIALLWIGNRIAYSADSEWSYFVRYNQVRTELTDYGIPPYDENEKEYSNLGISYVDYQMLERWDYYDNQVFDLETMEKIVELRESKQSGKFAISSINNSIKQLIDLSGSYFQMYVLLFLFLIFATNAEKGMFKYQLVITLLCLGELVYLLLAGRVNDRALIIPFISSLTIMMLFSGGNSGIKNYEQKYIISIVLFLMVAIYSYFSCNFADFKYIQPYCNIDDDRTAMVLSYTASHPDNLYVMDTAVNAECLFVSHGPLDEIPVGRHSNLIIAGGWMVPSPIMIDMADGYGDKYNIFKILSENSEVYWISTTDDDNSLILEYIRTHYNENAECTIIDTVGIYNICSFVNSN